MTPVPIRTLIGSLAFFLLTAPSVFAQKKPVAPVVDPQAMVELPELTFDMGYPLNPPGPYGDPWFIDQTPERQITVSKFWLDPFEVTTADFALFLTYAGGEAHFHPTQQIDRVEGGYLAKANYATHPIQSVTWQAADHYCRWAGKRLPSEAQWERAVAGETNQAFPWESGGLTCQRANSFNGRSFCAAGPQAIGKREEGVTQDGIHDLAGNVAEWVSDWYADYDPEETSNPRGPANAPEGEFAYKVTRGGGYLDSGIWMRAYARVPAHPDRRSTNIGFRCAYQEGDEGNIERGDLPPPSDEKREDSAATRAPQVDSDQHLVSGLIGPGEFTLMGESAYLLEHGLDRMVEIDLSSGDVATVADSLEGTTAIASSDSTLFFSQSFNEDTVHEIWSVSPGGTAATLSVVPGSITNLVQSDEHLYWSTDTLLGKTHLQSGNTETILSDLDGVSEIQVLDMRLIFSERGTSNGENTRIASISLPIGDESVAVTSLIDQNQLGSAYVIDGFTVDPATNTLYTFIQYRNWPYFGLLASTSITAPSMMVHLYSAPKPKGMQVVEGTLYWATNETIARASLSQLDRYTIVSSWTQAGSLLSHQNTLYWADAHAGFFAQYNID